VCSGLRSLLALLSLGVLYAWTLRDRGPANVLATLAAAVPAAVVGNGLRICLVAYLVTWLGPEAVFAPRVGTWDLHLLTGAVIFAAALACLFGVNALVERLKPRGRGTEAPHG
jgi:exosortase/archaeosortase family protein